MSKAADILFKALHLVFYPNRVPPGCPPLYRPASIDSHDGPRPGAALTDAKEDRIVNHPTRSCGEP